MTAASRSTSTGSANPAKDVDGLISRDHPNQDPTSTFDLLKPSNIPGVLPPIAPVLLAVILNRDFDVFPAHIKVSNDIAEFVKNWNLCLRARES